MTSETSTSGSDGFELRFGGGLIGAMGLSWTILGWFANGYPDGFVMLLALGGGVAFFIGTAQQRIHRARAAEPTPADDR